MTDIKKLSPTISVENPTASSGFYIKHFDAKVIFDCGWYINIALGNSELCFMKPQSPEQPMLDGKGLMYSFEIENVDEEHTRLSKSGVTIVMPAEEFKQYHKNT